MSNREALLQAAKKCLLEKGYNRVTARDIASEAGVSLAAIGYHFSSKEALLTEALLLAFEQWDQDLQQALQSAVLVDVAPAKRFEAIWGKIIDTFETHRSLWVANFEIFAQMVSQPEARKVIADKVHVARAGLAALFLDRDENSLDQRTVQTIGTFYHVLLSGLIVQWLIDPATALSAGDLTESLRTTAQGLQPVRKTAASRARGTRRKR